MRTITAFLVAGGLFLTMGCTQPKATTVTKASTPKADTKAAEPTKAEEKKTEEKKPEDKKTDEKKPEDKNTPPAPPK